VNGRVRGYVSGIVDAQITGIIHGEVSAQLETDNSEDMKAKVDRQIINHIDTDGKHIDDIDSVLPKDPGGAQPVTAGAPAGVSAEPGAVSTDEDVDDIMDETED